MLISATSNCQISQSGGKPRRCFLCQRGSSSQAGPSICHFSIGRLIQRGHLHRWCTLSLAWLCRVFTISVPSYLTYSYVQSLQPLANLLGGIYASAKQMNPNAVVRGIATDISNYNSIGAETTFYNNLQSYLSQVGYPAHFVVVRKYLWS